MNKSILVLSNWDFSANGSPERIARALALNGQKTLYARNPLSFLKYPRTQHREIATNLHYIDTRFLGLRVAKTPLAPLQWRVVARALERHALKLGHEISHVFYHDAAAFHALGLLEYFKAKRIRLVHLNLDVIEPDANAKIADIVLSIPPLSFNTLKERYGAKVVQIPQCGPIDVAGDSTTAIYSIAQLEQAAAPILTYLGVPSNRVDVRILRAIINRNPSWNLVHFGPEPFERRPNVIVLPWMPPSKIATVLAKTDVGIMPYNCSDRTQFGCVPLKLFDFFRMGIPVVSTPIDYTRYISDLAYVGATSEEFSLGIIRALSEEKDSPKREARKALANQHNLKLVGERILNALSDFDRCNPN